MGFEPKRLWLVLGRNMFLSGAMFVYFGYLGFSNRRSRGWTIHSASFGDFH